MSAVSIIEYMDIHQPDFERLNKNWIEKYFWMEPIDFEVLSKPYDHIIRKGGFIFMAQYNNEIAGTAALKFVESGVHEFTKMAVDEKFQGMKIGKRLALACIEKARELKSYKIILYSNTKLIPAINLYKNLGFKEIPVDGPYKRSDIKMELLLSFTH